MLVSTSTADSVTTTSVDPEQEQKRLELEKAAAEEEKKLKIRATVKRLFTQIKSGCKKDICFNLNCKKNPLCKRAFTYSRIQNIEQAKLVFISDQETLNETIKLCNDAVDPYTLICSESDSMNAKQLEEANESQMRELLEDAYSFSTSFIIPRDTTADTQM